MWKVTICKDIVKGQWDNTYQSMVYWDFFYILAYRENQFYIHFYQFRNDWEKANKVLKKILAFPDFTPENKPAIWFKIRDTKPIRPNRRKLLWWLK